MEENKLKRINCPQNLLRMYCLLKEESLIKLQGWNISLGRGPAHGLWIRVAHQPVFSSSYTDVWDECLLLWSLGNKSSPLDMCRGKMVFRTLGGFLPFTLSFSEPTPQKISSLPTYCWWSFSFQLLRRDGEIHSWLLEVCGLLTAPRGTLSTMPLEGGDAEATHRSAWAPQRIGASDLPVPRQLYRERVSVWGSISASKGGRRKHNIYPVESSTFCVLQSTLCFDESPWKHWNKTNRRLCLLPAFLHRLLQV